MRSIWPFYAGVIVAALVSLILLPVAGLSALALVSLKSLLPDTTLMAGESSYRIRDDQGRYLTRQINTTFTPVSVAVFGEPRPRRLLLRQQVMIDEDGLGAVRLDAWPIGAPADLHRPPLYTLRAKATSATLGEDGMLWIEQSGRRSAWSLADGSWLFDSDVPIAGFTFEADQRRLTALALIDEEFSGRGGVAVITYAAPGRVLRRVALFADNPKRAATLRATLTATRMVSFLDPALGSRVIELPLGAGPLRLPVNAQDLDLSRAVVPAGLRLVPMRAWDDR
jgi:hypothetical protein